jgi:alginate O-acetyltransferase complex protein AlgJ
MGKIKFYRNLLLIFLFMIVLCSPVLFMVSGYQFKEIVEENRTKAKFPAFKIVRLPYFNNMLVSYIQKLNEYFEDNFAFREILIRLNRNIKLRLLRTNPFPEKFVIGRDGWMFLGNEHSMAISETKGLLNFSESELDQISDNITQAMRFFDKAGVRFYLAIAPEKSTVYGEFLPITKTGKPTKLDQLKIKLLGAGCRIIDMKDDFKNLKNPVLYYKSDSHWNEFGEFIGSQTLLNRIKCDFPAIKPLQLNDFIIDTIRDYQGDNAQMLFLPWTDKKYEFRQQNTTDVVELQKMYTVPNDYPWNPADYERRYGNAKKTLKVLIFHDSFFREMPKFLAPDFKETVFIWAWWDKKIILNEKPDIVIYEKVERDIDNLFYPIK